MTDQVGVRERLVEAAADEQTVWREGDRIRRTDGTGYGDMVTDEQIRQHINDHWSTDLLFAPFAEAVLAIRAFERASRERSALMRSAVSS